MHLNKFLPTHNQHKENMSIKLRPGVFSNQANITAHYHQEYNQRPKSPSPYHQEPRNVRSSNEIISFESLSRIHTQVTTDNDNFTSLFHNEQSENTTDPNYYIYDQSQSRSSRPLQERTNQPSLRDPRGMPTYTARHGSSEKTTRRPSNESHAKMKKTSSYANLKGGNSNSGQKYTAKSSNAKPRTQAPSNPPSYGKYSRQPVENDENQDVNAFLGQSRGSTNITIEKKKSNNFLEGLSAYESIATTNNSEEFEKMKKENAELQNTVKKLTEDLEGEKSKSDLLETELNSLTTSITDERAKYQGELMKISQQIKKLRNIQSIYVNEKKNSEKLESELNARDKTCSEVTGFLNEILRSVLTTLELLLVKGDLNIEKHLQTQEFNVEEDYLKLLYEVRRILLPRIENAEALDIQGDWRLNDYKQIIVNSRELMKLRKGNNFKLNTERLYCSNERKSTAASTQYNSKPLSARSTSPITLHTNNINTYASNMNTNTTCTFSVTHNTQGYSPSEYTSKREDRNYTSLANGFGSRSTVDLRSARGLPLVEYVPFNARTHLIESFTHRERDESFEPKEQQLQPEVELEAEVEPIVQESFTQKKIISPSKFPEGTNDDAASLGSTIMPRTNNCSAFNETFDNLLAERFQDESKRIQSEFNSNSSKNYDLPLSNSFNINNPKIKTDLEVIKSKIMQRKSEIEARRDKQPFEPIDLYKNNITELSNDSNSGSSMNNETNCVETVPKEEHNKPIDPAPISNRLINPSPQKDKENITMDMSLTKEAPKIQEIQGSGLKKKSNNNSPLVQKVVSSATGNSPFQKNINNTVNSSNFYSNGSLARLSPPRSEQKNKPEPSDKPTPTVTLNQFAVAKFDYVPQKENDLKFSKGDRIQILKKTDSGWWIGLCNNKIGYFPYNFVTVTE